jgi:HD-GYP domain-containing protein (c-di-GMP phosphodiesterase class II)
VIEMNKINIDYDNLIKVIARSLDLVGIDGVYHAQRVAYMASITAKQLGYEKSFIEDVTNAALLHDCGVSSTLEHKHLIDEFLWHGAEAHCHRSYEFLSNCKPLSKFAEYVRYHHTPWQELIEMDLPEEVSLANNLIFLCDRLDALYATARDEHSADYVILNRQKLLEKIEERQGSLFDPELSQALLHVARTEAFWMGLRDEYLDSVVARFNPNAGKSEFLELKQVRNIGTFLARIIDAKSKFTNDHSIRVAALARCVASYLGLPEETQDHLELAGLLHDIGKLRVSDVVLEKNGKLTDLERIQVNQHALDTKYVLELLFPNSAIAKWAPSHHEKLNGSGYPFGIAGTEICKEVRILTCCDIFQALTQNRPYRPPMSFDDAYGIMLDMCHRGEIDKEVLEVILANKEELYEISST